MDLDPACLTPWACRLLSAARSAAELPEVGAMAVPGMPLVPVMAGDGAQLPIQTLGAQFNAPITIVVEGAGKDPPQVAKEVVRELRTLSQSKFGTTDRWSEL